MSNPEKLTALAVEPNTAARMRIKQATIEIKDIGDVDLQGELNPALNKLKSNRKCDIVFVSPSFPEAEIGQFIKNAKETAGGQDSAYVLVMRNQDNGGGEVARRMLIGADGCLFEPFSVDALYEIIHLATKVRKERAEEREKVAVTVLVNDICAQLDEVAYIKACQFDIGTSLRQLREKCSAFASFNEATLKLYFDAALTSFEAVRPRQRPTRSYSGVSSRVKDRMAKKIMRETKKVN